MLRTWYKKERVDTDLLDTQFEKIKGKKKLFMSNKEIENIAKTIIDNEEKRKEEEKKKRRRK